MFDGAETHERSLDLSGQGVWSTPSTPAVHVCVFYFNLFVINSVCRRSAGAPEVKVSAAGDEALAWVAVTLTDLQILSLGNICFI